MDEPQAGRHARIEAIRKRTAENGGPVAELDAIMTEIFGEPGRFSDWDTMTVHEREADARRMVKSFTDEGHFEAPARGAETLATVLVRDGFYKNVLRPHERLAVSTALTHYAEAARQMALAVDVLDKAELT